MCSDALQVDRRQRAGIRRTVRRVRGYWQRAGIPRKVRGQRSEELRVHLLEAVDDGRKIEDVVGEDVAAFAAEWAEAERSRPMLDLALQLVASVTLLPGGLALLHPLASSLLEQDDGRVGLPGGVLALLAVIVPVIFAWHLVRLRRHRLTTQQTALLGVALFLGYTVLFSLVQARWSEADLLVISPTVAWTLVAVGVASQLAASWLKRSRWR